MQGKNRRNPFGFQGFLTQHPPLFAEKTGILIFQTVPKRAG